MKGIFIYLLVITSFCFKSYAQKIVKLGDLEKFTKSKNDTLYVINFWATWCRPCIEELPAFESISQEYKTSKLKVILVALEFKKDYPKLPKFIAAKNLKTEVVILDEPNYNSWIPLVNKEWSGSIPATLFVKGSNKTYIFKEQSFEYKDLKKEVENNL